MSAMRTARCALNEVCEGFSCTTTFCGNGICDPEDEVACPEDCVDCASGLVRGLLQ